MEPRARAGKHKNGLNFGDELRSLLYGAGGPVHPDAANNNPHPDSAAYIAKPSSVNNSHPPTPFARSTAGGGTTIEPFPETLRLLDEIVTDFIIETCHSASRVASYSGRAKLKLADFEWVMRRDLTKLGRVQEMFRKRKYIEATRRLVDTGGEGEKMQVGQLQGLGDVVGEEGTGKGKGRGRGRRKKRIREGDEGGDAGGLLTVDDEDEDAHKDKRARSEVG